MHCSRKVEAVSRCKMQPVLLAVSYLRWLLPEDDFCSRLFLVSICGVQLSGSSEFHETDAPPNCRDGYVSLVEALSPTTTMKSAVVKHKRRWNAAMQTLLAPVSSNHSFETEIGPHCVALLRVFALIRYPVVAKETKRSLKITHIAACWIYP